MSTDAFAGSVIITWAKSRTTGKLLGNAYTITDAKSGQPITTTTSMTIHADGIVTAEMNMLIGEDGQPLGNGEQAIPTEDGTGFLAGDGVTYRTAKFRWLVVDMRTTGEQQGASL